MNVFSQNLIRNEIADTRTLIEWIETTRGFAIDAGGKIKHQWLITCDKTFFGTWFIEGLKAGRIRQVVAKLDERHSRHLRINCGMPTAGFELTYVAVANVVDGLKYIVTDDIDFWEPSAKKKNEKTKQAIKAGRTGCVYKYTRSIGIAVGTVSQALAEV